MIVNLQHIKTSNLFWEVSSIIRGWGERLQGCIHNDEISRVKVNIPEFLSQE